MPFDAGHCMLRLQRTGKTPAASEELVAGGKYAKQCLSQVSEGIAPLTTLEPALQRYVMRQVQPAVLEKKAMTLGSYSCQSADLQRCFWAGVTGRALCWLQAGPYFYKFQPRL